MFPRWSGDTRPGPAEARRHGCRSPRRRARRARRSSTRSTAPLAISPSGSTLSWSRSRIPSGSAPSRENVAGDTCGCCPRGTTTTTATTTRESPEGEQMPILNVFVRDGDEVRHSWATELMFAPARRGRGSSPRRLDLADLERAGHDPGRPGIRCSLRRTGRDRVSRSAPSSAARSGGGCRTGRAARSRCRRSARSAPR